MSYQLPADAIRLERDWPCPVCRRATLCEVKFGDLENAEDEPDVVSFYCGAVFRSPSAHVFGSDRISGGWSELERCGNAGAAAIRYRAALIDIVDRTTNAHAELLRHVGRLDPTQCDADLAREVRNVTRFKVNRAIGELWKARTAAWLVWNGIGEPLGIREDPEDADDRSPCRVCGDPVDDAEYDSNGGRHAWCAIDEHQAGDEAKADAADDDHVWQCPKHGPQRSPRCAQCGEENLKP